MTKMRLGLIVAFSTCFLLTGHAQTKKTIDSLESQYQHCLDNGRYMFGCSKVFYSQMDSMLNVVYFKLRSTLETTEKAKLKSDQREWLSERDAYFKKTLKVFKDNNPDNSPYGSAFGAQDDAMIMFDDNASFVKTRVLELLKRLNHQKSQL